MSTPQQKYTPEHPPPSFTFPSGLGLFSAFIAPNQPPGSKVIKWDALRGIFLDWKKPPTPSVPPAPAAQPGGAPPPPSGAAAFKLQFIDENEVIPEVVWAKIIEKADTLTKGTAAPGRFKVRSFLW